MLVVYLGVTTVAVFLVVRVCGSNNVPNNQLEKKKARNLTKCGALCVVSGRFQAWDYSETFRTCWKLDEMWRVIYCFELFQSVGRWNFWNVSDLPQT